MRAAILFIVGENYEELLSKRMSYRQEEVGR